MGSRRFVPNIAHHFLRWRIMGGSHWHMHHSRWFFGRFDLRFDRMRGLGLGLNRFNGFAENLDGLGNHIRGFGLNRRWLYNFTNRARLMRQDLNGLC